MGGLPRRATLIGKLNEGEVPLLVLDAGNVFADKPLAEASLGAAQARGAMILDAMEIMGYSALAVGELDLYLGRDRLDALRSSARIHFLSANVLDGSGAAIFDPAVVFTVGSARVGVFGLTSRPADAILMAQRAPGLRVEDPLEAAARVVPKLQGKCDLVVALTNIGIEADEALARAVPGIDVVIGGKSKRWMRTPLETGGAIVTSGFFQGRSVGVLTVTANPLSPGWVDGQQVDFLDRQILAIERGGQATPGLPGGLEELRARRAGMESLSRYDGEMVNLTPDIPGEGAVEDLIAAYRVGLKGLASPAPAAPDEGLSAVRYLGVERCAECHPSRTAFWKGTAHARAFSALLPRGAGADPECLPCHVTGLNTAAGSPSSPAEPLRGVQCEACHGMASLHAAEPVDFSLVSAPTAALCQSCHTPDRDDDFVYIRDRRLVCSEIVWNGHEDGE